MGHCCVSRPVSAPLDRSDLVIFAQLASNGLAQLWVILIIQKQYIVLYIFMT